MADVVRLYHGSKDGIHGTIQPVSREQCDFGRGFYMGTDQLQPLTLVCGYENAHLYTLDFDLAGLAVLSLATDIDWALYVALHRGKLRPEMNEALYARYARLDEGADVVVGKIANDRMFMVMDQFFGGLITDAAFIESIAALNIGDQYVAKTQKACAMVSVVEDRPLDAAERERYSRLSEENRRRGVSMANEIVRAHRRDGRFFDEIVESWGK